MWSPLDGEARPLRQERKVVTVLFADLAGFTARSERMDPEDVQRLLEPYHAHLRSVLERYGGTVAKFVGDAVMAIFGAPVAHGDDPERAVRAVLAIREELAAAGDLEVHTGITTGEVLITLDTTVQKGEHTASGDSVNTAARLESAAPAGNIYGDEATRRATAMATGAGWRVVPCPTAREPRSGRSAALGDDRPRLEEALHAFARREFVRRPRAAQLDRGRGRRS